MLCARCCWIDLTSRALLKWSLNGLLLPAERRTKKHSMVTVSNLAEVTRGCVNKTSFTHGCVGNRRAGGCYCNSDLCNGAASTTALLMVVLGALTVCIIMWCVRFEVWRRTFQFFACVSRNLWVPGTLGVRVTHAACMFCELVFLLTRGICVILIRLSQSKLAATGFMNHRSSFSGGHVVPDEGGLTI